MAPRPKETLAEFFRRVRGRKAVNAIANELAGVDGKDAGTWLRTLRRLGGANPQDALSAKNAAAISVVLGADFSPFIRRQEPTRALVEEIRDRLVALEIRVGALEDHP